MLPALSIAANGMAAQSQRLEAIAASVASTGATARSSTVGTTGGASSVRVGALPLGDAALDSMASMKEVELAYRLNAAVFATADEMLGTLLDMIEPDKGQPDKR